MSFTERDCDAMDHARDQAKERDHETRCRLNVKAPSGVLTGCFLDRGHAGECVSRSQYAAKFNTKER